MVITVGWKGQPISSLQPYSLSGPHNYELQGACKWEGLPIPPWRVHFTTMCTHQVQASEPFRGKMFKFWQHACTGTAFIRLVGILLFRGKFQILAAKETVYVRAAGTPPISLVGNRGKRSSFGSWVTVHAETFTDDERDLPLMHAQFVFSSTCSPSVRKPYVCQ